MTPPTRPCWRYRHYGRSWLGARDTDRCEERAESAGRRRALGHKPTPLLPFELEYRRKYHAAVADWLARTLDALELRTSRLGHQVQSFIVATATELAEKLGPLAMEHLDDLLNVDKLQHMAKQRLAEYRENPTKFMADAMTARAASDPCLRARQCQLVPYNQTGALRASRNGEGCCPGQTGHHVLPGAMFEGQPCYTGKHGSAPTICVEGVNNSHGSHGFAHRSLQKET